MEKTLDLASFEKALRLLQEACRQSEQDPENDLIRDACIYRFKRAYGLAFKFLERYLKLSSLSSDIVEWSGFRQRLRLGLEQGLIDRFDDWVRYREAWNVSRYAYKAAVAGRVFSVMGEFTDSAAFLLKNLQRRSLDL